MRRDLERRQAPAHVGPQRLRRDAGLRAHPDDRRDLLAEHRVRDTEHRRVLDVRVVVQDGLDLHAVHVLAAPDHQVLDPVHDGHPPVPDHGEIARTEPAAGERPGRRLLVAPVAADQGLAAQPQLARLPVGERLARRPGDPDLGDRRRGADGIRMRAVRGAEGGQHPAAGLGQPVAVARLDALAVPGREPGDQVRRGRRATCVQPLQALQAVARAVRLREQLERGGRDARVVGDRVPADQPQGLAGVPLLHQDEGAARRHRRVQAGERGDMEERERHQGDRRGPGPGGPRGPAPRRPPGSAG